MKSRPDQDSISFVETPLLDNPVRPALRAGRAFFLILLLVSFLVCWAVAKTVWDVFEKEGSWILPVAIHLVLGAILLRVLNRLAAIPSVYVALLATWIVTLVLACFLNASIGFIFLAFGPDQTSDKF